MFSLRNMLQAVVPPRYGHGVVGDGHEGGGVMLWQDREL